MLSFSLKTKLQFSHRIGNREKKSSSWDFDFFVFDSQIDGGFCSFSVKIKIFLESIILIKVLYMCFIRFFTSSLAITVHNIKLETKRLQQR